MASLPPRQAPPHREQSSTRNNRSRENASSVESHSTPSDAPEALQPQSSPGAEEHCEQPLPPKRAAGDAAGEDSVKKCWICFADSTEDTPDSSPWRHPCSCALVAHEECLLDWIADVEAPGRKDVNSLGSPKIECPQCKTEIKLARPRDVLVEAVRAMERLGARAIAPGSLVVLCTTLTHASILFGCGSIFAVFGVDDGTRILEPMLRGFGRERMLGWNIPPREIRPRVMDTLAALRLYAGTFLIAPMLVLSRTSIADSILPVLPVFFFATHAQRSQETLHLGVWPPSASLAFAILPYFRQAYNTFYRRLFASKMKQWSRAIRPRQGQSQTANNDEVDPAPDMAADAEDAGVFEVRFDGGLWEEDEEDLDARDALQAGDHDAAHQANADEPGPADPPPNIVDNRPPAENGAAALPQQPVDQEPPPNAQEAPVVAGERRLTFSATAIAETVLGALVFPYIAAASGELLRLVLPKTWTTLPLSRLRMRLPASGLLQERWGRSLVGGCLFVVVKDAVMLYVRWKMARMHKERRVLDHGSEWFRAKR